MTMPSTLIVSDHQGPNDGRQHECRYGWICVLVLLLSVLSHDAEAAADGEARYQVSIFSADVTIPLNHRCMGVLPTKSKSVADPLYAHGFVLSGPDMVVVVCAVDWCEIRNGAYDQWRDTLAAAAGTTRERVLVSSVHQHDAPVVDLDAARLLEEVGLKHELYDVVFHDRTLARVAGALKKSLLHPTPVTELGMGQARVHKVASNRRVVHPDGHVSFSRGSRSGSDAFHRAAPEGQVDPFLKTLSFWNGTEPVLALHAYATHPMSYYGNGEVSSDFVGLARARRQRDDESIHQIYLSGCSGDVTAGKYNNGTVEMRVALTDRIYQAMDKAWDNTRRVPLRQVMFHTATLQLPFNTKAGLSEDSLEADLNNTTLSVEKRILAAMGLASRRRVATGQGIGLSCIDFGVAQWILFPGETFVGYQLMAQAMRPDAFVMSVGYGESWPGYIPMESVFQDGFDDDWLWVAPGSEERLRSALEKVLNP